MNFRTLFLHIDCFIYWDCVVQFVGQRSGQVIEILFTHKLLFFRDPEFASFMTKIAEIFVSSDVPSDFTITCRQGIGNDDDLLDVPHSIIYKNKKTNQTLLVDYSCIYDDMYDQFVLKITQPNEEYNELMSNIFIS
ncbi:hypothetical protein DdX_22472 [Ditylenchus destructor]|uniref:Uncharacterized protein n=1 Tax=Ditylenchus destructor TaxID=166010 RepID=A0AAD4ME67_9BILA|nr:hypothetical protein DdX_22472 [Ditylenchus destructor]